MAYGVGVAPSLLALRSPSSTAPRPEHGLDADGWRPYVSGTVTIHPVEAAHGDLVRHPVADEVGTILAGLLR